jgi:DNA-directed RNA polymerase specialized sigma24 family protein
MTDMEKVLNEISGKMDIVVRLLALNLVRDMKVQKKQIIALKSFGFGPPEIADILETTPNTVYVVLSRARKKKKSNKKKAAESTPPKDSGEKNE